MQHISLNLLSQGNNQALRNDSGHGEEHELDIFEISDDDVIPQKETSKEDDEDNLVLQTTIPLPFMNIVLKEVPKASAEEPALLDRMDSATQSAAKLNAEEGELEIAVSDPQAFKLDIPKNTQEDRPPPNWARRH